MIYLKNTVEKQTIHIPRKGVSDMVSVAKEPQTKTIEVNGKGIYEITADEGKELVKVIVKVM